MIEDFKTNPMGWWFIILAAMTGGVVSPTYAQDSSCYDRIFPFFSVAPDESKLFFTHVDFLNHDNLSNCGRAKPVRKKKILPPIIPEDLDEILKITPSQPLHVEHTSQFFYHHAHRISQQKLKSRFRKNSLTTSRYLKSPFGATAIRKTYRQHSHFTDNDFAGQGPVEIEQFENRMGWVYDNAPIKSAQRVKAEDRTLVKRLHYLFPSKLSSNGCWLIGGGFFKKDTAINAKVYSLHSSKRNTDASTTEMHTENCTHPITWDQDSVKNRLFHPDLLIDPDEFPRRNGMYEGVDFDIYYNGPNELQNIWQVGFSMESEDEKFRSGDIFYNSIIYTKNDVAILSTSNLTNSCKTNDPVKYGGFESSPKFSSNGRLIYFLAEKVRGDESSDLDLYVGSITELKQGNCAGLVNLTEEIDYPVTQFQVTENGTELSIKIIYNGRTRVLFFALEETLDSARILYKYKQEISDFGFIFDYTTFISNGLGLEKKVVYVSASHTDFPTSVYKCNWMKNSIDCGSKYHPVVTNKLGNAIREEVDNGQPVVRYLEFPQVRTGPLLTPEEQIDLSKKIHRFVLLPKTYDREACRDHKSGVINNSKACPPIVLSIHGGPAEAWTGVFSIREYHLADLGYIVILPNPIGSLGFGQKYTDAVLNNWGQESVYMPNNKDYHGYLGPLGQLTRVLCQSTGNRDFCDSEEKLDSNLFLSSGPVYALGHSYGGYMVNWMQTKGIELAGFVSVNGLSHLPWFADQTDQLWFPKFHLKCAQGREDRENSGSFHCSKKFTCDKLTSEGKLPIIDQSPYCYLDDFNKNRSPYLAVFGKRDTRVPERNTKWFLEDLGPEKIRRSNQRIFQHGEHGLGDGSDRELARDLSCWFQKLNIIAFDIPVGKEVDDLNCQRRLTEHITDIGPAASTTVQSISEEEINVLRENDYISGIDLDESYTDHQYIDQNLGSFNILTNSF